MNRVRRCGISPPTLRSAAADGPGQMRRESMRVRLASMVRNDLVAVGADVDRTAQQKIPGRISRRAADTMMRYGSFRPSPLRVAIAAV